MPESCWASWTFGVTSNARGKSLLDGIDGIRFQQGLSSLGDHDRIHDQVFHLLGLEELHDGLNDLCRGQHAGFDGSHVEIVENGIQLRGDDGRGEFRTRR